MKLTSKKIGFLIRMLLIIMYLSLCDIIHVYGTSARVFVVDGWLMLVVLRLRIIIITGNSTFYQQRALCHADVEV